MRASVRREGRIARPADEVWAVVGRPDALHGEEVVAFVQLVAGSTLTGEDVVTYGRSVLSTYKYPREAHVVEKVPLTSVGKTDRKAVRALLAAR